MNPSELRATVAAQILSGLLATDDPFLDGTDDALTTHAIALTDLLLAKLNPPAPVESESSELEPEVDVWNRLDRCRPSANEACRVVVWDEENGQIESLDRLYWDDGMWQDSNGDSALGGVQESRIYWFPSHKLSNSETAIRFGFINYIESR